MARYTKEVVIEIKGRDQGKKFFLTEMSATTSEKWALRAWLAIAHSEVQFPQELVDAGWAGLAIMSLNALRLTKFEDLVPLMDELMSCVQIRPSDNVTRSLIEEDIEDPATRMFLKREVFDLHAGPFAEGVKSMLTLAPKSK